MIKVDIRGVSFIYCAECGFKMHIEGILLDDFFSVGRVVEAMDSFNKKHYQNSPDCSDFAKAPEESDPVEVPEKPKGPRAKTKRGKSED